MHVVVMSVTIRSFHYIIFTSVISDPATHFCPALPCRSPRFASLRLTCGSFSNHLLCRFTSLHAALAFQPSTSCSNFPGVFYGLLPVFLTFPKPVSLSPGLLACLKKTFPWTSKHIFDSPCCLVCLNTIKGELSELSHALKFISDRHHFM